MKLYSPCSPWRLLIPRQFSNLFKKGRHCDSALFHSHPQGSTTSLPEDMEACLYVHWPFCKKICTFCNFNKYASNSVDHYRMKKCLVAETKTLLQLSGVKKITSVYFGGGTPSLAEPLIISSVLETISRFSYLPTDVEITLEANPTSAETGRLRHFLSAGINRLSLGIQAFNQKDLLLLGRDNTVKDSLQALQEAKSIFPGKVSIDLLFGRPHQSLEGWSKELLQTIDVCDDHVSLYQLTLERGTPLFRDVKLGKLSLPSSDVVAEMYQMAVETLLRNGFHRYEISNLAKPGAESKHNMAYWNGTQYIGVGPGAHSRFIPLGNGLQTRQARVQTLEPNNWMKEVEIRGHATRKEVPQTKFEVLEEVIMSSLRTADGLSNKKWHSLSPFSKHLSLSDIFKESEDVQQLVESGLLILNEKGIKASHRGLSVVDSIITTLLVHLEKTVRILREDDPIDWKTP